MAGRCPDDKAQEFAADTLELSTRELAKKWGIAISTVKDWRLDAKERLELEVGYGSKLKFLDRKEGATPADEAEMWSMMAQLSAKRDQTRLAQDHLSIEVPGNQPVAFGFFGDMHTGVEGVLYDEMDADFDALAAAEGVYAVGNGDYAHNPKAKTKPGENLYRMIIPDPDVQYRMAMYQIRKLEGKLAGLIKGCHDDWDAQIAGFERVASMCQELDCAYLGHGAVIEVKLGTQVYRLLARHKYKFESSINITNAQRRAWESIDQADAVIFAHLHHNVSHIEPRSNGDVIYMRSGSYFHWDEFGMKIGHYKGQRGIPLLVLYPDQHRIVPFYGPHMLEGLRFLEAERAHYQ
jgi:hypothetical protein